MPAALVEKLSADMSTIRERRATLDSADLVSENADENDKSSSFLSLTPPDSQELQSFVSRSDNVPRRSANQAFSRGLSVDESAHRSSGLVEIHESVLLGKLSESSQQIETTGLVAEAEEKADSGTTVVSKRPSSSQVVNSVEIRSRQHVPLASRGSVPVLRQNTWDVSDSLTATAAPPLVPRRGPPLRTTRIANVDVSSDSQCDRSGLREFLRGFFAKRTTADTLKQRGILKDEPVFGGTLHYST